MSLMDVAFRFNHLHGYIKPPDDTGPQLARRGADGEEASQPGTGGGKSKPAQFKQRTLQKMPGR